MRDASCSIRIGQLLSQKLAEQGVNGNWRSRGDIEDNPGGKPVGHRDCGYIGPCDIADVQKIPFGIEITNPYNGRLKPGFDVHYLLREVRNCNPGD